MEPASIFDLRAFPLVYLTIPDRLDGSYVDALEASHAALFARRERYVSIADSSRVTSLPDAVSRRRLAEWTKSHEPDFRRLQVANALLVSSSMIRAGLSAVHWFAPPPVPTAVETTREDCLKFVRQHADQAGLRIDWSLVDRPQPRATAAR